MSNKQYFIRVRGQIRGPFTVAQLKSMRDRGQFHGFHEVSDDRRTWSTASSMADVFGGGAAAPAQAETATAVQTERPAEPTAQSTEKWFYLGAGQKTIGPYSREQLAELWQQGTIDANTLVCKEGLPSWVAVSSPDLSIPGPIISKNTTPLLPRRWSFGGRRALVYAGGAGGLLCIVAAGVWVASLFGSRHLINDASNDKYLTDAVCKVVCGAKVTRANGELLDDVEGTGTGFLISNDGYVVTNKHVVANTWQLKNADLRLQQIRDKTQIIIKPTVWVFFGKEQETAEIVHVSDEFDMCLLKVPPRNVPYFKLARTDQLPRGKKVIVCGFPGAATVALSTEEAMIDRARRAQAASVKGQFKARDFEFSMTEGTISRVTTEQGMDCRWIQHTASINPGNSGGPLLLEDGTVVGINTLLIKNAQGVFYSMATAQLRSEIDKHVSNVSWK